MASPNFIFFLMGKETSKSLGSFSETVVKTGLVASDSIKECELGGPPHASIELVRKQKPRVFSVVSRVTELEPSQFSFFFFLNFYWSRVDLQCCVSFRHTAK